MCAMISIKGFKSFLKTLCTKEAFLVNLFYNSMWVGTLYFSIISPNYFGAIIFGLGYMLAILFVLINFIPGGAKGLLWTVKKSVGLWYKMITKVGVWGVGKGASYLPF